MGTGSALHRQVIDVHQVAVHFPRHLRLLFRRAGDYQVTFVDLRDRTGNGVQRQAGPPPGLGCAYATQVGGTG